MNDTMIDELSATDPIAQSVDWSPVKRSGNNYRTRELIEPRQGRLEYKPAMIAKVITWAVLLHSAPALLGTVVLVIIDQMSIGDAIAPFLFSGGATVLGYYMWSVMCSPIIFDGESNMYWRGGNDVRSSKTSIRFDDIHAIQLVSKRIIRTRKYHGNIRHRRKFNSVELNLVLSDGSRINVLDHSKVGLIRSEAARLGELIGVPVWDATATK